MARELTKEVARRLVPEADRRVLRAGHDVLGIEANVQHASVMVTQTTDRVIARREVPDDTGTIRGAGDHDGIVVLKAEDGAVMVKGGWDFGGGYSGLGRYCFRKGPVTATNCGVRKGSYGCGRVSTGNSEYLDALICVGVPYSNRAISRAGQDFMSSHD